MVRGFSFNKITGIIILMKKFKLLKKDSVRIGEFKTLHGTIKTPVFMPCATVGAVKAVSAEELKEIGFEIILGNTYHLYLRPSDELIKEIGGLHQFMNWDRAILTDSGGYQVFSLGAGYNGQGRTLSLVKIKNDGVEFKSHLDGSRHLFTPEKVIDIQLNLGSDIIMPLDYCPSANASKKEIEEAVNLTNRWFERAWLHFQKRTKTVKLNKKPALFAIIQGGAHKDLREKSFKFLSQFPVDGFAIGGVANAGESKLKQKRALEYTLPLLPEDKPRYLMGVGEPEDIILAVKKGVDMFDSVLPTRLGRHGVVWVTKNWQKFLKVDLRKTKYRSDKKTIMKNCPCPACKGGYSKAYISHLIRAKEMLGLRLASLHNLAVLRELMVHIRNRI